jgi:hypothetical protein
MKTAWPKVKLGEALTPLPEQRQSVPELGALKRPQAGTAAERVAALQRFATIAEDLEK